MAPREELLELIEAYADAKVSGNQRLRKMATTALASWISHHDIVTPMDVPEELVPEHLRNPVSDTRPRSDETVSPSVTYERN